MTTRPAAVLIALWSFAALAGDFRAPRVSPDGKVLQVTGSDGRTLSAPVLPDQVGFDNPQVAPDRAHVGWLALYPNCCTSYPIPMELVVMDAQHDTRSFTGNGLPIFDWCFLPDSKSVAYMQTVVHGSNFQHYERRSLADGKLLAEYDYPDDPAENDAARKNAPAWVSCVPQ